MHAISRRSRPQGVRGSAWPWAGAQVRCIVRGRVAKRSTTPTPPNEAPHGAEGSDLPTVDAVLSGLERVVAELEGGDLPLEEALARFERGVALVRRGSAMLDTVEERVEVLLADRDETVPLVATDSEPPQENDV